MSADSSAAASCAGLSGPLLLASTQEIAIADVARCGLVGAEVRAGLVAVEIPEPGNTITAAASTDDSDYAVTVAVDPNGDATISSVAPQKSLGLLAEPDVELGDEGTSALQNRCTDNRNALFGHKWFKDFNYWVNDTENQGITTRNSNVNGPEGKCASQAMERTSSTSECSRPD